ncbi:MAG: hypothetical protein PVH53_09920, partial [Desulfobacterales bacterium]
SVNASNITIKSLPVNQKALSQLITSDASDVNPVDIHFAGKPESWKVWRLGRLKAIQHLSFPAL